MIISSKVPHTDSISATSGRPETRSFDFFAELNAMIDRMRPIGLKHPKHMNRDISDKTNAKTLIVCPPEEDDVEPAEDEFELKSNTVLLE